MQMSNNRGLIKAPQQELLTPSALGPLAEMAGDTTMDSFNTALWAHWGFKWLPLQILWVAKWSTSIFCSLNDDTWPLGPMMGFHFLPCRKEYCCKPVKCMFESHITHTLTIKIYSYPPYSNSSFGYFHLQRVSCCHFQIIAADCPRSFQTTAVCVYQSG